MTSTTNVSIQNLIHQVLLSRDGCEIGIVRDILINTRDDKAEFLLIEPTDRGECDEDALLPLRFSAVSINHEQGCFELDAQVSALTHLM